MDTIKVNSGNTKMIAHRGMSGLETENSLPAFVAAGNRSYFGEECDIHVTADEQIVVIHDENTGRVALQNINVEKTTLDEIRRVQLRDFNRENKDSTETRADLVIPTMKEYITVCKKYGKVCVIELKNRFERNHIIQVIDEIKSLDYLDDVIFISFSYENMVDLRELLPDQPLQFLISEFTDDLLDKLDAYDLDLDIHFRALDKDKVDAVHGHGHKVNCWTCDSKDEAEKLVAMGVDFITTNILE